ncbi:MAG: ATP-dependent DNA helicase UvrD2 [Candidatus Nanopelagicales bacterium]
MDADDVLAALDPEQREVAASQRGPMCVLAGAGTGKTRAITHRIAYGVLSGTLRPAQVLPVTFSARAATEMHVRLRALGVPGVRARTFHAAALSQLRYFWPTAVGSAFPTLEARKAPHVAAALARQRLASNPTLVRDVAAEIEWAKVSQVSPDNYEEVASSLSRSPAAALTPVEIARVYASYEQLKRDRSIIDFEDCLLLTVGMLEERTDIAATVRQQYTHVVVDEYQDVNSLQQRLLDQWLGERDSICVVGDPAQTIYSFAGASPEHLVSFRRRFPHATVVRLVRDYRSTPQIVSLANRLLHARPDPTSSAAVTLRGQRPDGPQPVFVEATDETAEADGVAAAVRRLLGSGVRPSEAAVLVRVNAQTESYEQALGAAGVPYVLRGGARFFERPEVRRAVILLRGAARASTGEPGQASLPDQVQAVFSSDGWSVTPPRGAGATRDAWESLAALAQLAEELAAAQPGVGLPALVDELDRRIAAQHAPEVDGVTIATLHAAKGLEWDAVFLVGLTEGLLPIAQATTSEQVEEERRLLYVGVTRARVHLTLSWALARSPGAGGRRRRSRFLDGLVPGGELAPSPAKPRARRAKGQRPLQPVTCRGCGVSLTKGPEVKRRRCGSCAPSYDPALFEALRSWRSVRASAAGFPAYVVFTDATLEAIADLRPSESRQLTTISGIGAAKLRSYGDEVLAVVAGADPEQTARSAADRPASDTLD